MAQSYAAQSILCCAAQSCATRSFVCGSIVSAQSCVAQPCAGQSCSAQSCAAQSCAAQSCAARDSVRLNPMRLQSGTAQPCARVLLNPVRLNPLLPPCLPPLDAKRKPCCVLGALWHCFNYNFTKYNCSPFQIKLTTNELNSLIKCMGPGPLCSHGSISSLTTRYRRVN